MGAVSPPRRPVEVAATGPVDGMVAAPASKSVTNRALVMAALADDDSVLAGPLDSDDSAVMRRAVTALGAGVRTEEDAWRVTGTAGRLSSPSAPIDVGLSGTTMRFVAALATLTPDGATVTGGAPLLRRPVGPLVDALTGLGARVGDHDGRPPVEAAGGGLAGGSVAVDVTASSQFASALLLVAPYARADVMLAVRGPVAGAYVTMTAAAMGEWGAAVTAREDGWAVTAGAGYRPRHIRVEYDASAAAHLLAVAAATGGRITVTNAAADTHQPDAAMVEVLAAMGAAISRSGDTVTVTGPDALAPGTWDMTTMPDQVTTVAALAALAEGTSVITGAAVARGHETDRLAALATELGKLGVAVEERPDGLVVHGRGAALERRARLSTHDDHRLAMAFAAVAARVGGVVVDEPWCVTKTYPGFWEDLRRCGVEWREVPG